MGEVVRHFDARFEVDRLHLHQPFFAVGLRVEPANQVPAVDDRQRVVAVLAARGGRIHLDAVLEAEEREVDRKRRKQNALLLALVVVLLAVAWRLAIVG